jgi:hypothetical protein
MLPRHCCRRKMNFSRQQSFVCESLTSVKRISALQACRLNMAYLCILTRSNQYNNFFGSSYLFLFD